MKLIRVEKKHKKKLIFGTLHVFIMLMLSAGEIDHLLWRLQVRRLEVVVEEGELLPVLVIQHTLVVSVHEQLTHQHDLPLLLVGGKIRYHKDKHKWIDRKLVGFDCK